MFLIFVLVACSENNPATFEFQQDGTTMGTTFSVKITELPQGVSRVKLKEEINNTLDRVNSRMSTYQADSELSKLNQNRSIQWIGISRQLSEVLQEALQISELSQGAYDVTVGPLVNLWGFGPQEPKLKVPNPAEIRERLKQCGFKKIHLNGDKNAFRKDRPDIYIDLSSLAKGYGVDQLANLLNGLGIDDYLVEIGGELRVRGAKGTGMPWKIGIEKPLAGKRSIEQIIELKDIALATSGDYRNYFEVDGVRYSHTIDPGTGKPVAHALASVTVMDKTALRADALATALMVLGPDAGFSLARKYNLAALFIKKEGSGFVTLSSPAFPSIAE